jgi:hypothetical protein
MRRLCHIPYFWVLVPAATAAFARPQPGTGETVAVIEKVQADVIRQRTQLPDFICHETITSQSYQGGRRLKQAVIVSSFTGLQSRDKRRELAFTEIREVKTVNGKAVRKGWKLKAPYLFEGGFSSSLWTVFGPDGPRHHLYGLAGERTYDGKPALVVEFRSDPSLARLYMKNFGQMTAFTDKGTALVDPASYEVKRLKMDITFPSPDMLPLAIAVSYKDADIAGETYSLPEAVRVREGDSHSYRDLNALFLAEYTNYRKFEVNSEIQFEP